MQQHKGVQPRRVPGPTHGLGATIQSESEHGRMPQDEQLRISYGTIAEVNEETGKVRVDVYDEINRGNYRLGSTKRSKKGNFIPIIQPISEIHLRFGQLRDGLAVRVYWRGKSLPGADAVAEIISDDLPEIFKSGTKNPESNVLDTGPYKIFSGGTITRF